MTTVRVSLRTPDASGVDAPAVGRVDFTPTRRRMVDDSVVLPAPFEAVLVDGVAVVDLAATGPGWCWRVVERVPRGTSRYVVVPEVGPVGYEDLTDVDPATLAPDPPGVPGWVAALPDAVSEYLTEHPPERGEPGPEGPQGPEGIPGGSDAATAGWVEAGPLTRAALREVAPPLLALVDEIPTPTLVAHRGGGVGYPESSLEGMRAAVSWGAIPDVDLYPLADGTLALCHLPTAQQTTTLTGNLSALTRAQWKAGRIKAKLPGLPNLPTATWYDALAEFGGRHPMAVEVKDYASIPAVIASVKARGLQRSIWLQSTSFEGAAQIAAAGIASQYISNTVGEAGGKTRAEVAAAGIEWVLPYWPITKAQYDAHVAAGLQVMPWPINTHEDWMLFKSWGGKIACSDLPDILLKPGSTTRREDWSGTVSTAGFYLSGGLPVRVDAAVPAMVFAAPATGSATASVVRLSSAGFGPTRMKMRFWATCPATPNANPEQAWIWAVSVGTKGKASDPHLGQADEQRYLFQCRHDGGQGIYYRNGASETLISTGGAADPARYPTGGSAGTEYEYEVEVGDTQAWLRNVTLGTEIVGTHSGWHTGEAFISLMCQYTPGRFRDIRLSR